MRFPMMLLTSLFCGASATATAQQSEPMPAATSSESLPYDSAFVDYRPMQEVKMAPTLEAWRAANDAVARIGGHAGVLKGGQSPDAHLPAQPASTVSKKPFVEPGKTSPHQGH